MASEALHQMISQASRKSPIFINNFARTSKVLGVWFFPRSNVFYNNILLK